MRTPINKAPFTCEEISQLVDPRCPDYEPFCVVCDFWEMWDTHAYGAIQNEIEEMRDFMIEYYAGDQK